MALTFPLVVGIIGALCVLVGFLLVQRHIWSQDDRAYDILNCTGSSLLLIYGWMGEAWPFVVLNAVWAAYSLKDIIGSFRRPPSTSR